MFFNRVGIDDNVINIYTIKFIEMVYKKVVDVLLKIRKPIRQVEQYNLVFIKPNPNAKCNYFYIFLYNLYFIKGLSDIDFRKNKRLKKLYQYFIDK